MDNFFCFVFDLAKINEYSIIFFCQMKMLINQWIIGLVLVNQWLPDVLRALFQVIYQIPRKYNYNNEKYPPISSSNDYG